MEYDFFKHLFITKESSQRFTSLSENFKKALHENTLSEELFIEVCAWKSHRRIDLVTNNTIESIKMALNSSMQTNKEKEKVKYLTSLSGVSIPMASAILTMQDPSNYGVIDNKAWSNLYNNRIVTSNPKGVNLTEKHWIEYLTIIRKIAKLYNTTPRIVELNLFNSSL